MKNARDTGIYKKSVEIFATIHTIVALIPEDDAFLLETKHHILENIMVI